MHDRHRAVVTLELDVKGGIPYTHAEARDAVEEFLDGITDIADVVVDVYSIDLIEAAS